MKVRDLFSLNSEFTNLKLLAGKDGLDREITKVEIMEVPDGVFWAKENSMIVTMGYSLKKNDITTDSLVQMLIEKKVSALGIKMGRYIEEIPQRVLDYADDNAFPIINIPLSLSYDQIITPINNRLLDSASYESYIVRDLRKKLRNLVRHDYSPESVLGLMAGYINKKVTIMWAGNFNYVSGYPFQNAEILTDIVKNNIKAIYECDGEITLSSSGRSFTIFKLENAHSLSALLCVEITPDNPITNTDYEIIEELIPTLTLYLLSNSNLEFSKNKSNENLFFDLIQCKYKGNDLKLVEDASFLNIPLEKSRFCVEVELKGMERGKLENFITVTKKLLEVNEDNFFLRAHDRQLTVIVESNTAQTNTRFFEPVLLKIYDKLTAFFPKNSIYAGVSNICNSLHNLNFTYDEANFALTAGKKLDKDKYLFFYEDYMIFHLLSAVSEHPTINKIYKNTVDRLKKYDGEHEQELLKTLSALVENDFSVAETSKALFIHRNTLYKRIEKINSVLNFNIDQSKNRLLLQLALTLDKML